MKKIRLAFAGFRHGHIYGLYSLAQKKEDIEIAGAWETFPESVAELQKRGIPITYADYASALADPKVDAVAIGDCYGVRGTMAIQALDAGKHVIADKPLCTSPEELEKIRKIASEKGLKVGLMLDLRTNGNVCAALRLIREGAIGEVNNIYFGGQHPLLYGSRPGWYFEAGKHGGVINDIAVHGIDLVRLMTGCGIRDTVGARCWNFYADREPSFQDSAQFLLKMENGAGVCGDVSYAAPDSQGYAMSTYWRFDVSGRKGTLTFSANSDGVMLYANGEKSGRCIPPEPADSDYLDDFIRDIQGNGGGRFLHTAEVLETTEQTLLVQQSAGRG